MDNSVINKENKNQRPGVIEDKSSKINGRGNEEASAVSDGPFRGIQSARGLAPAAKGVSCDGIENEKPGINEPVKLPKRRGRRGAAQPAQGLDQIAGAAPCRILISHVANLKLDEVTARINRDFEGGQITKPQVLEWFLSHSAQNMTGAEIEKIRATYFDRVAYLECLLKRAKETGIAPPELDALFAGKAMTGKLKRKSPGHSDPAK